MKEQSVYVYSEIEETIRFLNSPLNETMQLFLSLEPAKEHFDKRYREIITYLGDKNEVLYIKSKDSFQIRKDKSKFQGKIKKYKIEDNDKALDKIWVFRSLLISGKYYEKIKVFGNKRSADQYYRAMNEETFGLYSSEVIQYYLDKEGQFNG